MTETPTPRLPADAGSPEVVAGVQQIIKGVHGAGVPQPTLELVHMRTSQINGCDFCIASGTASAERAGLGADRLLALPAWRDSSSYDEAERAAIALAEAMTRLADRPHAVDDGLWAELRRHYDDRALSALVAWIALTNFFNRVNTTLRVPPGTWG